MERHVKERLVGATILVVLIVLIVPELLSGPKRAAGTAQPSPAAPTETIRSVTVDLATNQTTASIEEPAAAAASSAATPSAAASSAAPAAHDGVPDGDRKPDATSGAPPNAPSWQAQAPAAAKLETGSSSPKSETKGSVVAETHGVHAGWTAQLGSFSARANAEKLDRELRAQGFAASLSASGVGLAARYRVRVGPIGDRLSAERLVAKLKRAGHPASVVPSG